MPGDEARLDGAAAREGRQGGVGQVWYGPCSGRCGGGAVIDGHSATSVLSTHAAHQPKVMVQAVTPNPPESANDVSVSAADSSPLPPLAPSSFAAAAARCRSFFFFFLLAPLLLPLAGGGVGTGSVVGGRGGRPNAAAAPACN